MTKFGHLLAGLSVLSLAGFADCQIIIGEYFNATFNQQYFHQVSSSTPVTYFYRRTSSESSAVRVTVSSTAASEEDPILVIIKRQRSVLSWQIPLLLEERYRYCTTSRTLCPMSNYEPSEGQSSARNGLFRALNGEEFFVEILTRSNKPIAFSLLTMVYPQFQQTGTNASFKLTTSPAEPQYIQYNMPPGVDRFLVKLSSNPLNGDGGDLCSYLSVQSCRCPVGDLDADLRLDGRYQTVTTQGAIEVTRNDFNGSFYIVVLVKPHDRDCEDAQNMFALMRYRRRGSHSAVPNQQSRTKTVLITVVGSLAQEGYILATLLPIGLFMLFFVVSLVLLQTSCRGWHTIICGDAANIWLPTKEGTWVMARAFERSVTGRTIPSMWDPTNYKKSHILSMVRRLRPNSGAFNTADQKLTILPDGQAKMETVAEQNESSTDDGPVSVNLTSIVDLVDTYAPTSSNDTLLRMSNFNKISSKKLTQTSSEYSCTLMVVFLFYSLPVFQLVLTHQALLLVTGNEDLCFYNFSCANRVGILSDFNHIISNIGYVLLGILFLVIVRRRAMYTAKLRLKVADIDDYGIPSQLGLFYGMGLALVMEGFMSACYHVCPSYNNFQFDTSFMYLIAGLLILKLYHGRHPDILPRSYVAYMLFAGFIFVALVGVVSKNRIYWIVFSVFHGLTTIAIGLQLFFVGYLELGTTAFLASWKIYRCSRCRCPDVPWSRVILASLITLINLGFVIAGPLLRPWDFATHLLFILQGNLIVYAGFYATMKIINKEEKISRATCLYFLLGTPAWLVGMYYFTHSLSNWEVSAAVSREGNKECFFFNFYDEHDVWHMLSAFGLFFTFMMLLTLDDDLATVSREKISVF